MTEKTQTNPESTIFKILNWKWLWVAILLPIIIGIFFFQFAMPILDGDPWWQMAYGRYFIENRTLIPDHTIFTWSYADNDVIYCAWISEILLFLLYKAGGLPALFVLRYLCMSVFLVAVCFFACKTRTLRHPLTWLFCLLGLLISANAGFIKPELSSYVFICLTVLNWMIIKSSGEKGWKYCYFFPLIMLIWVNSHGGFIFGAVFLFVMFLGEEMNALYSPNITMSLRVRRHLFAALCLSALAIFLTPYGWKYPINVVRAQLTQNVGEGSFAVYIRAYDSIFAKGKKLFYYVDYLIICSAALLALVIPRIRQNQFDWAMLLTNGVMIFFYTLYTRSTYLWVPVFTLSAIYLLSFRPRFLFPRSWKLKTAIGVAITCVCIILSVRFVYARIFGSWSFIWPGFGISYIQPVEETEFIQTYLSGYRIANDYNTGGYLLWKLYPGKKIFIDPRHFPFLKWSREYFKFEQGINIDQFLEKNRADVWCIQHQLSKVKAWFLNSPDWKPAFYGPSSVVFVRSDIALPKNASGFGYGISDIKNMKQAASVLKFALDIKDWKNAGKILSGMKERYQSKKWIPTLNAWQDLIDGMLAYHKRDYALATKHLENAKDSKIVWSDNTLVDALLHVAAEHWNEKNSLSAREAIQSALNINPNSVIAVYNMGVIEWFIHDPTQKERNYEDYLTRFLKGTENNNTIPAVSRQVATAILNSQYDKRPPLLRPEPPAKYEPEMVNLESSDGVSLLPDKW